MKYVFLLVFVQSFFVSNAQFVPLPLETGIWKGQQSYNFGQTVQGLWQVQSSGDSLIGNLVYQKFFPKQQWFGQPNNQISSGLIRQEEDGSKVYYRPLYEEQDYLLFDFTMEVGDTLQGYYSFSSGQPNLIVTVSQADSIVINGEYRKRIIIPYGNEGTIYLEWIEGIGSKYGMVFPEIAMFESHSELECMNSSENTTFYPYLGYDCMLNVGQTELSDFSSVTMYLNEANKELLFKNLDNEQVNFITVFSIDGKLMQQSEIIGGRSKLVNLSNGIYLLQVFNENGKILAKSKMMLH